MPELRLLNAEKERKKLTAAQEKHIKMLYKEALKEAKKWSESLKGKENVSSVMRRKYLDKMENDLSEAMQNIGKDVEASITNSMSAVAGAVVKDANKTLNEIGLDLHTAYSFVPAEIVQSISTGSVYGGNWTLSKAIWGHTKKSQQDIHDIIAKGVLENKSSYDIAKALEQYVNPSAAKPWDWGKIYPGTAKKIDYNAQRLARTLVSHAYQQSFVRTTKDNPFFEGYRWLIANNHRVCPICQGYAEDVHADGLPEGVFPKDELPLDHPNGQCTFSVYMNQTTDQIVDSLAAWAHGENNKDLDQFAESLGYSLSEIRSSILSRYKQLPKSSFMPAHFKPLTKGSGDAELTDSIYDYAIPESVRNRLDTISRMKTYEEFKTYFELNGIKLNTDIEALKDAKSTEEIKPVFELGQKIVVALESYKAEFGSEALTALKEIILYSESETSSAAYYYNILNEHDPLAGTIRFRDWNANGRTVFHEMAHAFQDSQKGRGEDALTFSDRVMQNVDSSKLPDPNTSYTDTTYNAEKMADIFGYGFYLGNSRNESFMKGVFDYLKSQD